MIKVYKVNHGKIDEYELISESEKSYLVRSLNSTWFQTRIYKDKQYTGNHGFTHYNRCKSFTDLNQAKAHAQSQISVYIKYHQKHVEKGNQMMTELDRQYGLIDYSQPLSK